MYQYSIPYDDGKQNILITVTDWGNYIEIDPTINGILMIETNVPIYYKMHWREAENYAKKLNKGGYSDWRLPTTDELKIIYKIKDCCGINSSLDFLWASEKPNDYSTGKWGLNFNDGTEVYCNNIKLGKGYVCCVR